MEPVTISKIVNVRNAMNSLLVGQAAMTTSDWRKTLAPHWKDLAGMETTIDIEWAHLTDQVDDQLKEITEKEICRSSQTLVTTS